MISQPDLLKPIIRLVLTPHWQFNVGPIMHHQQLLASHLDILVLFGCFLCLFWALVCQIRITVKRRKFKDCNDTGFQPICNLP